MLESLTPAQLKATQENLPVFLEAIWHVSVVDIERTLTAVTHKVSEPRRADRSPRMHALTTACRPLPAHACAHHGVRPPPAQLCRDHSVDESTRLQRAHALRRIGAIFMEEALAKGGSKVA